VYFESLGPGETQVRLELEYEPEGPVEKAGDALGVVGRQARTDLDRFKKFIEGRTSPTGAWRGQVNPGSAVGTPGLDDAAGSRGDSGKAGLSGKAVVAGAAAAAVGAAAAHAASSRAESSDDSGTGFRDVVDVLTADHREVTDLLAAASAERDAQRRRDLADIIITELVRHSVAEEMHVYPVMREHLPDGEQAVEHDMEEHKEIESTLKALEGVDADSPEFDETLRRLQAILTDHVQDEETEQFPLLRARVPSEKLVELAAKVETAKKLAPTRPHPAAPNSAAFHKLVGPGVGFVDRLRDKLSSRATPDS
jgi:hemerythrin superfamily protein